MTSRLFVVHHALTTTGPRCDVCLTWTEVFEGMVYRGGEMEGFYVSDPSGCLCDYDGELE